MSGNGKVVLIGLDGATFRVLRPLIDDGVMPTVARFMREGAWGNLLSTRPPVTCPAWPTMFTGVNPGKHGLFSFSCRDPASGTTHTASSSDVLAPRIWDLIGRAGTRVAVINVPMTFPAEEVNGVMMSGFVSPDESPRLAWPTSAYEGLRRCFPDLAINWDVEHNRPRNPKKRAAHVRLINQFMKIRNQQFEYLLGQYQVGFCFLVFEYPDRLHHCFYKLLDPAYEAHGAPENRPAIALMRAGYHEIDRAIAELFKRFGEETNYIIVSDHGFDGVSRWVYVNKLLELHGMCALRTVRSLLEVATRKLRVPQRVRHAWGLEEREAWHRWDAFQSPFIDYDRSKAFAGPPLEHAVYLNVKGRWPGGVVEAGEEYDRIRQEVIEVLRGATDPRTGQRVFDGAWARERLFTGSYVERAPDVIYELAPGFMGSGHLPPSWLLEGGFLRDIGPGWDLSGYHRPEGVLIGFGPAFRSVQGLEASIVDVAPTVLYLMDLPIPSYMDGRLVEEALSPELLRFRAPRTCDSVPVRESGAAAALADEELVKLIRRFEALGYL